MTEREEDEELLLEEKDEIEESGVIKRFNESPYCEWVWTCMAEINFTY